VNFYYLSTFLFRKSSTAWPTRSDELLVKAALLGGDKAIDAWQEWKSKVSLNQIDDNSQNLYPLLYKNLLNLGIKEPDLIPFKKVYKITEVSTSFLFQIARKPLRFLQNAGIRTMLLKGAALSTGYYKDSGLRPMMDIDVLVQPWDAQASKLIMENLGWIHTKKFRKPLDEPFLSYMHSVGFEDSAEFSFDINWHLINLNCSIDADAEYWTGAGTIDFQGISLSVLNPTYQLLHVCIHGLTHIPMSLKWIPDAWIVLNRASPEIDWELLMFHIQKAKIVPLVKDTFFYLHNLLDAPIPVEVLNKLGEMQINKYEQREYYAVTGRSNELGSLPLLWVLYHRRTRAQKERGLPTLSFIQYLQYGWGLERIWNVPIQFLRMAIKRIGMYIRG
jgi:hypothetical protein